MWKGCCRKKGPWTFRQNHKDRKLLAPVDHLADPVEISQWAFWAEQHENRQIFNIIRWVAGSIISLTKHLMVKVLFLQIENKIVGCWLGCRAFKTVIFIFVNFLKNEKINWMDFCKEFCKTLWKRNIYLEHEMLCQWDNCPSVIYWRLSALCTAYLISATPISRKGNRCTKT